MKNRICTSIEQSKKLVSLGISPETSDMVWLKELMWDDEAHCTRDADTYMLVTKDYLEGEEHRGHIPAWSLHSLLDLMPKYISGDGILNNPLEISKCGCGDYLVGYEGYIKAQMPLYDAVVTMIEHLIKDGYMHV